MVRNKIIIGKNTNIEMTSPINIAVIGAPGSGKTNFFLRANIFKDSPNNNFIFFATESEDDLIENIIDVYENRGYEIKLLDLGSNNIMDSYNPFEYFKNHNDINMYVGLIMDNIEQNNLSSIEKVSVEKLLNKVFTLIFNDSNIFNVPKSLKGVLTLLEDYITGANVNIVQHLGEITNKEEYTICGLCIDILKRILVGQEKCLLEADTLDFKDLFKKRMIVIIKYSKFKKYNAIIAGLILSQLLYILKHEANEKKSVNVYIKNFAELGRIYNFREYLLKPIPNVNLLYFIHSIGELNAIYGDSHSFITTSNILYYGANEIKTLKELSKINDGKISTEELWNQPRDECLYISTNGEILKIKKF